MGETILFRCDATADIGLGHLVRCLVLAKELKESDITFATTPDPTNERITRAGYGLFLKDDRESEEQFMSRAIVSLEPDILVVDRKYPYSVTAIRRLRVQCRRMVLIDYIYNGMAAFDVIIFPNAHFDRAQLPCNIAPGQVKDGPEYVVVRDEVLSLRSETHPEGPIVRIAVTTGGSDPSGVLVKILPWLAEMKDRVKIIALVGESFKRAGELESMRPGLPENMEVHPYGLREIQDADIVICTFGISVYEMVYLNKPTICISHSAENAEGAKRLAERYGAIVDAGHIDCLTPGRLRRAIGRLMPWRARVAQSQRCSGLIDGKGAKRIAEIIEGFDENSRDRTGKL